MKNIPLPNGGGIFFLCYKELFSFPCGTLSGRTSVPFSVPYKGVVYEFLFQVGLGNLYAYLVSKGEAFAGGFSNEAVVFLVIDEEIFLNLT